MQRPSPSSGPIPEPRLQKRGLNEQDKTSTSLPGALKMNDLARKEASTVLLVARVILAGLKPVEPEGSAAPPRGGHTSARWTHRSLRMLQGTAT